MINKKNFRDYGIAATLRMIAWRGHANTEMGVMKLIKQYGLKPSRRLGQHFLVSRRAVERFVDSVDQGMLVYEVGCGLGSLTIPLAQRASYLVCCELDERLARILSAELRVLELTNVDIVVADALRFELSDEPHVVVSNTPFNISSRLVVQLCRDKGLLYAVLGVQKEVGNRLLARPGEGDYGRLSVIAQLCYQMKKLFEIPPSAFLPKPEVTTLVIRMAPKRSLREEELAAVEELTRRVFSMRRKKISRALREALKIGEDEARKLLDRCGVVHDRRVYELQPEQFLRIAREISSSS